MAEKSTEVLAQSDLNARVIDTFRLEIVDGPMAGRVYESTGARTVIGTHKAADFFLKDGAVSRFHCEISMQQSVPQLHDLGSRNGTVVDGVRVNSCFLGHAATIEVGRTKIRFAVRGETVSLPIAHDCKFGLMVGGSAEMRAAFETMKHAAQTDVPVLLRGEPGTGKDLAAASIHVESMRKAGPFIVVDCSGPERAIERRLFGADLRETGSAHVGIGAIEQARGGTLYLDEIASLSLALQSELLRCLERGRVMRPGAAGDVPIDVRVIGSTQRNLHAEVNAKRFRTELYLYFNAVNVELPPLRERALDVQLLVPSLLETMGAADHVAAKELISAKSLHELSAHPWPGNVRELRVHLERCLALDQMVPLVASEAPDAAAAMPDIDTSQPIRIGRDAWIRWFERQYLQKILEDHGDNVSAAARSAGVDRAHFYRLLARAGLR